ncbi:hypothetical protein QYF36_009636 [Acer negundo]|nr:hypothetical protein QYF36_009636 [Acer negundo]
MNYFTLQSFTGSFRVLNDSSPQFMPIPSLAKAQELALRQWIKQLQQEQQRMDQTTSTRPDPHSALPTTSFSSLLLPVLSTNSKDRGELNHEWQSCNQY